MLVLKKTVSVSFEKNLGEFSISGVFSGMMMIFSLFSFWALSLFKFNVHFNFHFHCWDLKSLFLLRWQNDAGFESEFQRMAMNGSKLQRTNYCRVHYFSGDDDDDEVSGKIRKKFPRMAMQIQDLQTFFYCRGRQFL